MLQVLAEGAYALLRGSPMQNVVLSVCCFCTLVQCSRQILLRDTSSIFREIISARLPNSFAILLSRVGPDAAGKV